MDEQTLRFASALADMVDGHQEHDLRNMTGLSDERCQEIYQTFTEALEVIASARTAST